jgi:acetyltransferase-like isoleucine patch superfamily enzyme
MKIFHKITNSCRYRLQKCFGFLVRPTMLNYSKNFQGKPIQHLRISNSTFIDYKQNLFIGNNVFIGHFNFIEASNKIILGKGCQITNFITLTTHSSHQSIRYYGSEYTNVSTKKGYTEGSIEIGDFTFIGPHSTILPKTKIGKGCIVSAYSFVKGDFPDFSIIAGNPAQIIGTVEENDQNFLKENPELQKLYMK